MSSDHLEIKQELTMASEPNTTGACSNSVSSIPTLLHDEGADRATGSANHLEGPSNREEDPSSQQQQHQLQQYEHDDEEPLPTAEDAANAADNNGGSSMYRYRDFGHVLEEVGEDVGAEEVAGQPSSTNRNGSSESSIRVQKFPVKLYAILAQKEFQDIICWMPHGRSWKVLKPSMFESLVMPLFFEYSNYHSFNRLVNAWSFRRISSGPDRGSYYHELFLRGKPHLQKFMRRLPKTHKKLPMKKKDEPDFYKLDQTNPLPQVHEAPVPGAAATVQAMRNGPITPNNMAGSGVGPVSNQVAGGMNTGSPSTLVTPNISPYHQQNIIGMGAQQHPSNMMRGSGGTSPIGSMIDGMNGGYMGGGGSSMNTMNFMNSGGMGSGGGMMNSGFGPQSNMGMMSGGNSHGGIGNMSNMMGGMGGPMSNNNSAMGNMGGASAMSNMGSRGGSGGNSMGGYRFHGYNDMGSQDEYDIPVMPGQQHQTAYSPMNQMNSSGNSGYGNGVGYMGSGGNVGGGSYSSVPTPQAGSNSGGSSSMRRTGAMGQQGIDNRHQGMGEMQHMAPQHQQQFMNEMYMPQGPMQDMMPQHQHHSQYNMYSGRPINGGGTGSPSMNQQQLQLQQDDFRGSGSTNVMQQQQQGRSLPSRSTA